MLAQFLDCILFRKKVWGAYTCSKVECSFYWSFSSSYVSLCFRFWFLYFSVHVSCMCESMYVARFVNINSIELGELKLMSPFRVENENVSEKISGLTFLALFPQVFLSSEHFLSPHFPIFLQLFVLWKVSLLSSFKFRWRFENTSRNRKLEKHVFRTCVSGGFEGLEGSLL